jgi:hypothetical protein
MIETQNGLQYVRSCTDPTFCLKLIEKQREYNLETCLFIFYDKVFDIYQGRFQYFKI